MYLHLCVPLVWVHFDPLSCSFHLPTCAFLNIPALQLKACSRSFRESSFQLYEQIRRQWAKWMKNHLMKVPMRVTPKQQTQSLETQISTSAISRLPPQALRSAPWESTRMKTRTVGTSYPCRRLVAQSSRLQKLVLLHQMSRNSLGRGHQVLTG